MAEYCEKKRVVDELTQIACQVPDRKSRIVARCINAVEQLPSSPANERRPIDAVALEARLCELCDEFDTDHLFIDAIIYEIGMAPTIGGADNG